MKVCHFAATKGIGRGEAFVELANAMSRRIETHLLFPRDALFKNNIFPGVQGSSYKCLGSRNNPFLLFEVYRYFKKNDIDLVHTHFAKATQIFARLNRFLGMPHLATKHNPRPSTVFQRVKHVTVVSSEAVPSVANVNSSVKVIRNGISVKPRTEISSRRTPGQPFEILAIGRLDPIKGFDLLIEQLSDLRFEFILSIAGEGNERSRLESIAQKKLGEEKFRFLGFRHDVENLIRKSDLVISSSHSEGCPMVLIEALFHANLFISTPVGEAAELLPEAFIARVNEISAKINEIQQNYSVMSRDFRDFADQVKDMYSAETMVDEYLKAYDCVLDGKLFQ